MLGVVPADVPFVDVAAGRSSGARRRSLTFLPIPALLGLMTAVHFAFAPTVSYDPAWLILLGNALFLTGVSLVVSWVALRSYAASGRIQVLLLGCGVLVFGIGGALAAMVRSLPDGANLNVSIYNTAALLGGALHFAAASMLLAGVSPEAGSRRRTSWLLLGYTTSVVIMLLLTGACFAGLVPRFFVQGVGPTTLRQWVLGGADVLFLVSSLIFMGTYLRTRETFLYWYACGLALTAISLMAFLIQRSVGGAVGWVGRLSQYAAGVYYLVALLSAARTARRSGTSIDDVLTGSLSGAEEKFRALAENAPDVIRRFDRELRHVYVNPAGQRLYGKAASAVIGKRLEDVGAQGDRSELWVARVRRVFETGEPTEVEEYLATAAGTRFYRSHLVPELGPDRTVVNVLVLSHDLTEHKRAEEALRDSEERYRLLFQNMLDGFAYCRMLYDDRGRPEDFVYLDVNGAFERLTGLRDVVGKKATEAIPGIRESHPDLLETYGRVARTGKAERFEIDFRPLGMWLAISVYRPQPDHFVAVFDNITDRRRAEEQARRLLAAVHEEKEKLSSLINSISDEVWFADTQKRFTLANAAALGAFRLGAGEVDVEKLAGTLEVLRLDGTPRPVEEAPPLRALTGEIVRNEEEIIRTPATGELRYRRVSSAPVRNASETIIGSVTVVHDITEYKRAEKTLREADQRKDEFLGMLSHELRNPLATIGNALYILDNSEPAGHKALAARDAMKRQFGHLTRIVDDLLDVTRIVRGKVDLRMADLELADLVRRVGEDHRAAMHNQGVELVLELPDQAVPVRGDGTRLAQVLGNLLHNAAKFTPAGGRVTVSVTRGPRETQVRVRDTGVGIEREFLEHVFEPFSQATQTLARSAGGLGLGLALVKGLVELHGGAVSAGSDGPGRGSEFVVTLPLAVGPVPERSGASAAASTAPAPARAIEILVIDDNLDAAESMAAVLTMEGHRVHVANDGRSGIATARELRPEVILCDIGLPDVDGYEVARSLRADEGFRSVRLIALSGYAQAEDRRRAAAAGFDAHLPKPPPLTSLLALVRERGGRTDG